VPASAAAVDRAKRLNFMVYFFCGVGSSGKHASSCEPTLM